MILNLDTLGTLTNDSFSPQAIVGARLQSSTELNGLIEKTDDVIDGPGPFAGAQGVKVTSVTTDGAENTTLVLTATINGASVVHRYAVVGVSGNDLLLSATTYGDALNAIADGTLYVLATDGVAPQLGTVPTFTRLMPPSESVAAFLASPPSVPGGAALLDSTANVVAHLDALAQSSDLIAGITFTDGDAPVLALRSAQIINDYKILDTIILYEPKMSITLEDSAADLLSVIDNLQAFANSGFISQIALTDKGIPALSITNIQLDLDRRALSDIDTPHILVVDASAPNLALAGLAGSAIVVKFSDAESHYAVASENFGTFFTVTDTATGRTSVDHLSDITALQFSDGIGFVAQTPGQGGTLTTGNVAALYSAVLGRAPDIAGLAYYQNLIATTPAVTANQLAQTFLTSPEYLNNPVHAYAPTAAGEAQFVTDIYANLLHRAPEAGAVAYYQGIINQFTQGLDPAGAAYQAARLAGHAQLLADFSVSSEFIKDVQITAQHPADAQHFLYII